MAPCRKLMPLSNSGTVGRLTKDDLRTTFSAVFIIICDMYLTKPNLFNKQNTWNLGVLLKCEFTSLIL